MNDNKTELDGLIFEIIQGFDKFPNPSDVEISKALPFTDAVRDHGFEAPVKRAKKLYVEGPAPVTYPMLIKVVDGAVVSD